VKSPADKTVVFTFCSHPMKDPRRGWRATVVFAPGSTAGSVLPITVTDGAGEAVPSGVFEFAGCRLEVAGGSASITYGEFIAGKHSVPLWLHRPGIEPVPGGLTFA
jgi:hypothetical protein